MFGWRSCTLGILGEIWKPLSEMEMEQQGSKPPSMGEQMRTHFLLEVNFIKIMLGFNFDNYT